MARRHRDGLTRSPCATGRHRRAHRATGGDEKQRRDERTRTLAPVHAFPLPPAGDLLPRRIPAVSEKEQMVKPATNR